MRNLILAGLAGALFVVAPAHAQGGGVMTCDPYYTNPDGSTGFNAYCVLHGYLPGVVTNGARVYLGGTALNHCPTGVANGTMCDAVTGTFSWTRLGAVGVFESTGDIDGAGVMAFSSPCASSGETIVITFAGT